MKIITLLLSLLILSTNVIADEVFSSIGEFKQKVTDNRPGDFRIISTSDDINGDGIADWTGIIFDTSGKGSNAQIYILTQESNGKYRLSGKSQPFDFIGRNPRSNVEDVEVTGKNSFSIQVNSRSVCGADADSFTFKLYQEKWRLSGEEYLGRECDEKKCNDFSIDFISGLVKVTLYQGDKSTIKKLQRKFPAYFLQDFKFFETHENEDLFEYQIK